MKNTLLLVFSLTIICLSCKKEDPAPVPPVTLVDKFMTFTTGSVWNFEKISDPSSANPDTIDYTITSSSRDTTINTKQYHVFDNNNGGTNEYFYNNGNDYYTYRKLPSDFGDTYVEIIYLKDNAPVGTEWSQTYPITYLGIPLQVTLTNKIEERGITKTINGKNYTDVIKVSTNITATGIPFAFTITDEINNYFAPKYGAIKEETRIDIVISGLPPSNFDEDIKLMSATLK